MLVGAFAALWLVYLVGRAVYIIYFSDLSHIPGPKLNALTMIPYSRHLLAGTTVNNSVNLHKKFGDVVRIGPNEISFIAADTAYPDIYGFRTGRLKGHLNMSKDPMWYTKPENGVPAILMENDENHGRVRRVLAHAFSERAVAAQEPLVQRYIDQLIGGLKETKHAVDMAEWTTFDVITDLMFGEAVGCLQELSMHKHVTLITESLKSLRLYYILAHYPWLKYLGNWIFDKSQILKRKEFLTWVSAQVTKRIERETTRPDFMTWILENNGDKGARLSRAEINSNAALILNAGSETTATVLSATTWLLLKNADVMQRLKDEVRGRFTKYDEIALAAVNDLPYLIAVMAEGLRFFPPVPVGFGRVVPKGGDFVSGYFVPEGTVVSVSAYAAYHSERNFKNADAFLPERWMGDEAYANDKRTSLQPFSFGPRSCLGRNLAYAEMRLIMAKIIWSFDLELETRSEDWMDRCRVMRLWWKPELAVRVREVVRT
ncbi:hypothetical protein B7463_g12050, partial [Scytalidium lignicola]